LSGLRSASRPKPNPLSGDPKFYPVAELDFEDADELKNALRWPEMAAVCKDAATLDDVPMTVFRRGRRQFLSIR
jgi:hypothetical protein